MSTRLPCTRGLVKHPTESLPDFMVNTFKRYGVELQFSKQDLIHTSDDLLQYITDGFSLKLLRTKPQAIYDENACTSACQ